MKKIVLIFLGMICQISFAQTINIPDPNFKAALIDQGVDTNNDGEIQVSEAEAVTYLSVGFKGITSLEGISSFTNLTDLDCSYNEISSIDISNNTVLKTLYLDDNPLTSVDVSNNTALEELNVNFTALTSIDVSNNTALKSLKCSFLWQLSSIDVSNNTALEELTCGDGNLTAIDVTNNPALVILECGYNEISSIDVSNNPALEKLEVAQNQLTSLDVSNNVLLEELRLEWNQVTSLDVSNNPALDFLNFSNNEVSAIDVSSNPLLDYLIFTGNQVTTIDVSNNPNLGYLSFSNNQISSLDVTNNLNLGLLNCGNNQLTSLDLSNNILGSLRINGNSISFIDISNSPDMSSLSFSNTDITSIDLSNQTRLKHITFDGTPLTTIDLSNSPRLINISARNTPLETMFIKNGGTFHSLEIDQSPNLVYICADPDEITKVQEEIDANGYTNCVVNSFCTFVPGGDIYHIEGNVKVDIDQDGCDPDDLGFPYMQLRITDSDGNFGIYSTDDAGNYDIAVPEGSYTVTYEFPYSSYFDVSPPSFSVDFPEDASPVEQDICLTPNGTYDDLQVIIVPIDEARPGFDANYQIIYANVGTTLLSGNVQLSFDDDVIDFVSASTAPNTQNTGELTWSFDNLAPLEYKTIDVVMNLNTPTETPPLNGDEILCYEVSITPSNNDENSDDNSFSLKQTVVNSYDPNDKTCLEGNVITPDLVGEYVHYLIRFENTGTASAINVVVRDVIDTNQFDMSSFVPLDASHDFVTRIQNDNAVEFIFEGIELPFDDANNDGYVLFKIKTLPTLEVGDTFENSAEIYFDFNFPIITNVEQTLIDNTASTDDFVVNSNISLYPNPASEQVTIQSQRSFDSVIIYDLTGREISRISATNPQLEQRLNISNLKGGIYYLTIVSGKSRTTQKFLKL